MTSRRVQRRYTLALPLLGAIACNTIFGIDPPELVPDDCLEASCGGAGDGSGGASASGRGGNAGTAGRNTSGASNGGSSGDDGGPAGDGGTGASAASGPGGEGGGGAPGTVCGDGLVRGDEACDDGARLRGDGCDGICRVEVGWTCSAFEPTSCAPICGDGRLVGDEMLAGRCDDAARVNGDGCSSTCRVEPDWFCNGAPSNCARTCGNGRLDGEELCDDGNTAAQDGCLACQFEPGFSCEATEPTRCTDTNECDVDNGGCDVLTSCTNTTGSFSCGPCPSGYTGSGETGCTDINECSTDDGGCDVLTSCTNTGGGRTCGACPLDPSTNGEGRCDANNGFEVAGSGQAAQFWTGTSHFRTGVQTSLLACHSGTWCACLSPMANTGTHAYGWAILEGTTTLTSGSFIPSAVSWTRRSVNLAAYAGRRLRIQVTDLTTMATLGNEVPFRCDGTELSWFDTFGLIASQSTPGGPIMVRGIAFDSFSGGGK